MLQARRHSTKTQPLHEMLFETQRKRWLVNNIILSAALPFFLASKRVARGSKASTAKTKPQ